MKYQKGITGGTFDHFHAGHKALIDTAFATADFNYIGVTQPEMLGEKAAQDHIEAFQNRLTYVKEYLEQNQFSSRAEVFPIHDIYGPGLKVKDIEVIFATKDNLKNVEKINAARQKLHCSPLDIVHVPYVLDENGDHIASQRIRLGEIDREGHVYKNLFDTRQIFILPEEFRQTLRKPFGEVFTGIDEIIAACRKATGMIISVGDIISLYLYQHRQQADISIGDLKTQRHALNKEEKSTLQMLLENSQKAANRHGTIDSKAVDAINTAIHSYLTSHQKQTILIDGEEDLLGIPAMLLAPLGSLVLYGQANKGVVLVEITEEKKAEIKKVFSKFL